MPYIKQEDRERLAFNCKRSRTAGELNYLLTMVLANHMPTAQAGSYAHFNELIGALECCKLELYRRRISPYEDQKATENGDIY